MYVYTYMDLVVKSEWVATAQEGAVDRNLVLRYSRSIGVHVITRRRLNEFAQEHPECASSLAAWYRIVKHTDFESLADVRRTFPSADRVGRFTVFNVGGNKARLIAAIHYNRKRVYIRQVLTHAEYDRGIWKE